jgi:hypothetical protein
MHAVALLASLGSSSDLRPKSVELCIEVSGSVGILYVSVGRTQSVAVVDDKEGSYRVSVSESGEAVRNSSGVVSLYSGSVAQDCADFTRSVAGSQYV